MHNRWVHKREATLEHIAHQKKYEIVPQSMTGNSSKKKGWVDLLKRYSQNQENKVCQIIEEHSSGTSMTSTKNTSFKFRHKTW